MAKMRSPNYPAIGLNEAVKAIEAIWEKEKRTAVPMNVLGKAMGYNSVSGPVRTKVAALRKYGLLEEVAGNYRLSDLAMQILHGEVHSPERSDALVTAAMRPEIFSELRATHLNASDEALKSFLLVKKGFSEAGVRQFIKAFRETMEVADEAGAGYIPVTEPKDCESMAESQTDHQEAKRRNPTVAPVALNEPARRVTFSLPVSKDVVAEVTFRGGEMKGAYLKTLAKYLELMQSAVETEGEN